MPETDMNDAVIFDLDGTLADCTHRLHHVRHGRRDWEAFFGGIADDSVATPIRTLLFSLRESGYAIVLCSGRPEKYRQVTVEWLLRHGISYSALYMRPDGDFRADHVVKAQILDGMIEDGYRPFLAIDDRQSIVEMWRERGICCLQCAPDDGGIPESAVLTLMVGPSGAGKSTWLKSAEAEWLGIRASQVISSDDVRRDMLGDFKDQSANDRVFEAVHAMAKTRLRNGLPTVIDATHLRRRDRLNAATLVPVTNSVRYVVVDRPMAMKRSTADWRPEALLTKHDQTFNSQLLEILRGDGLPNVVVYDRRIVEVAAA